jgi:hypothetical protein
MNALTRVKLSIALLVLNFALCFSDAIWTFMPSDRAWHVAIVYAVACAAFQVHAIRLGRARELEFKALQTTGMRKFLEKPVVYIAITQSFVAFLAFTARGVRRVDPGALAS